MKKGYLFLLLAFGVTQAQIVNIPDPMFKSLLLAASPTSPIATNSVPNGNPVSVSIDTNNNGEIEVSEAAAVTYKLDVSNSAIHDLTGIEYFHNIAVLDCSYNALTSLDVSELVTLESLDCSHNQLTGLVFGDAYYNNISVYDTGDVLLEQGFSSINCSYNQLSALDLDVFSFIVQLDCSHNALTSLDLSANTAINSINCSYNLLTELILGNCQLSDSFGVWPYSGTLDCSYNNLTSLDLSNLSVIPGQVNLPFLFCSNNQLTTLLFPETSDYVFDEVDARYNMLASFDLTCKIAGAINLSYNQLTTYRCHNAPDVTISHNALVTLQVDSVDAMDCSHNQLTNLDLPPSNVIYLDCSYNNLLSLSTKGNLMLAMDFYQLAGNPDLAYVCTDTDKIEAVQTALDILGYNAEVNSLCYPTGGSRVVGTNRIDSDMNGCSDSDPLVPYIPFKVDDDTTIRFITDATGMYECPLTDGTHTLYPIVTESYFTVSPSFATVTVPSGEGAVADFCITPNGIHRDIRVTMWPIGVAVPGFPATYQVRVENRGTVTEDVTVSLSFDDTIMDFVAADIAADTATSGVLNWTLGTIGVLQARDFQLQMDLNTPVDSPPLDLGDELRFTVSAPLMADETPNDNAFAFLQTVVNALDPNDKTCLEGNTISPDMAGKYLHYLIRFENTGNYPAQIVTVEDMIDTTKFDISTIEPLDGSHTFTTRITGNKVEFIFNNIMLPFDDANNDGWVLFRIKTKPTLVLGDSVSNTAGIYFNFNPPVITNTATTTFATMGVDSHFDTSFTLWPNPSDDIVHMESKRGEAITSVSVYNTLGQELLRQKGYDVRSMNVSVLAAGTYVITVATDKSKSSTQLIKK